MGDMPPAAFHEIKRIWIVEPINRALQSEVGRNFVVAFRRRITIQAVNSAGIDTVLVRNVFFPYVLAARGPRRPESGVEFSVRNQHRRFDLRNVPFDGRAAVESCRRRKIGSQRDCHI
jgi:hypothetical protein